MAENGCLNGCLNEINLEFVEREATPRLLMRLSIQLYLLDFRLRMLSLLLRYLVSNALDPPSTIGFTRPIYSPNLVGVGTTLRLTRP